MYRKLCSKIMIVLLWMIISIGIYQCSVDTEKKSEQTDDLQEEEPIQPEQSGQPQQTEELPLTSKIRVLIKTSFYENLYHDTVQLYGSGDLFVRDNEKSYTCKAGELLQFQTGQLSGDCITVTPTKETDTIVLENVARNSKVQYRGKIECHQTAQGLVVVNELPLEAYLYGVLPSEMPSSYPLEALKAQAISARTYAMYHMKSYAYPQWQAHVDDSTDYQVYLNTVETQQVKQAVDETKGQVMTFQGEIIESFYYATSSGYSAGYEVWNTKEKRGYLQVKELTKKEALPQIQEPVIETFASYEDNAEKRYQEYIKYGKSSDIEYQEPWYRWHYQKKIDAPQLLGKIAEKMTSNQEQITVSPKSEEKTIKRDWEQEESILKIEVAERLQNGLVNQLYIETGNYQIVCRTQQLIRQLLATSGDTVVRQDNSLYTLSGLLPSGYFYLETIQEQDKGIAQLAIYGGGFGHGAGMSQNGAKCLALEGMTALEILNIYYTGINIQEWSSIGQDA